MQNLEQLKKHAKQVLRWHRDRHYPVAAQIRAWLPRFGGWQDAAILEARFQLADAQELVARSNGYESWPALVSALASPPGREAAAPREGTLIAAEPQLFVSDIEAACGYYRDRLGFAIAFAYGEPPFYAQVVRGGARLNLRRAEGPVFDSGFREREPEALAATIVTDDARTLFGEFIASGATLHRRLRTEPWGARTFVVADPDGNLILFAGDPR